MGSVLPPPDGDRQEVFKAPPDRADTVPVSTPTADSPVSGASIASDITASMHQLLDHVVGHVPGVVGAVVGSADGFSLAARLPASATADAASVAAMSAALLSLASRLVQSVAPEPSRVAEVRSEGAHSYVFAVAHAATLTVLATPESDRSQVMAVGREVTAGLLRLLRGTADV
jgi:uncharacterized protein